MAMLTAEMPYTVFASTEEGGSGVDSGGGDEGSDDTEEGGSDDGGTESQPEPESEPEPQPEEQNNGENNDDVNNDEPLPYCDEVDSGSCHDRDDYDEETGLFPCNDGSQRSNPDNCPDATDPVIPPPTNGGNKRIEFGSFSIQGIGGSSPPTQTGPIPVPKEGEAILKIIYEDEWSGSILDSNMTSISYDGTGNYAIVFPCESSEFYSLSIQKGDDDDDVMQLVVQDYLNQTLDSGQTTAEFGIVSLSGDC